MSVNEQGREGERYAHQRLSAAGIEHFQPDWLFRVQGGWALLEVKRQERFLAPPFDGHGLPPRQVAARLRFQEETGIRALLWVWEIPSNLLFWQWLDLLEKGEYFDTNGVRRRRIYPLSAFAEAGDF